MWWNNRNKKRKCTSPSCKNFVSNRKGHCPNTHASKTATITALSSWPPSCAFHTPSAANSSKQALNDAARLAFLHFTSESSDEKSEEVKKEVESSKVSEVETVKQMKEEVTYKSKLQELCQKKKWALPKYTCIRDGEDHCPQFKASVVVCRIVFDTLAPCTSSKQALNQVAQLAFLHFTSHASYQKSGNVDKKILGKEVESFKISEDKSVNHCDLHEGFKNKLRMYTQRKNLHQPAYCTEREGHCFKARVCVGEDWFTSNELFTTAEEAENSAAATALLALLTDAFHEENDPSSYKILLNKLANNEGFFPPTYITMRHDESDSQSFSTTVEIEGEVFQGDAARSEKLAELNSAKAAYTALIERKLFEPRDQIIKLGRRFDSCGISDPRENPTCVTPSSLIADNKHETDQVQGTIVGNEESNCMSKAIFPEMKGYLLSNRVRVFTCMPNMVLPKGKVVLPISEDKWAVVALEFPNEKEL